MFQLLKLLDNENHYEGLWKEDGSSWVAMETTHANIGKWEAA